LQAQQQQQQQQQVLQANSQPTSGAVQAFAASTMAASCQKAPKLPP
jgi:hypothetical protein